MTDAIIAMILTVELIWWLVAPTMHVAFGLMLHGI